MFTPLFTYENALLLCSGLDRQAKHINMYIIILDELIHLHESYFLFFFSSFPISHQCLSTWLVFFSFQINTMMTMMMYFTPITAAATLLYILLSSIRSFFLSLSSHNSFSTFIDVQLDIPHFIQRHIYFIS